MSASQTQNLLRRTQPGAPDRKLVAAYVFLSPRLRRCLREKQMRWSAPGDLAHRTQRHHRDVHRDQTLPPDIGIKKNDHNRKERIMKSQADLHEELRQRILNLSGVTERQNAGIHEDAFFVGRTMFMHIHGHGHCDIQLSKLDQGRVLAEGKARPHRWAPENGYVTLVVDDEADDPIGNTGKMRGCRKNDEPFHTRTLHCPSRRERTVTKN